MTSKVEKMETVQPQLLRRIDRNSVAGDKETILGIVMADKTKTHLLYRVGGICVGVIRGESKFGEWIKLNGRFKAVNYKGEEFVAGSAFLPPDLAQMVADRLEKSESGQLQFLFDVFARFDADLATSYGYIVEPVRAVGVADPLDELFSSAGTPALTGPANKGLIEAPKTGSKA